MIRINWKTVAILVVLAVIIAVYESDPAWLWKVLIPSHWRQDQIRGSQEHAMSLILLAALIGLLLLIISGRGRGGGES